MMGLPQTREMMKALDYSLLGDTYLAVSLEQLRALLLFGAI
jgi:hypothetical protein